VGDFLLQPEGFGMDGYGGIRCGRDVGGAAEDVDDVNGFGDIFEAGIGFLAEDFGFVGIDGDDAVTRGLEVRSYLVAGAGGIGGETDHGDGFGLAEELGDGVGGGRSVIGEMEKHFSLMMGMRRKIEEFGIRVKS
jgi:hypothetical protein